MTGAMPDVTVFTVEKANSALPLVRRIVADITAEHPVWRDLVGLSDTELAAYRSDRVI